MKRRTTVLFLLLCSLKVFAVQPAVDTLLFTIKLNDDTTSIYGCQWNDKVSSTLAGPVLMAGKYYLFYSQNGYVLYNENGKLLDSHSLLRENSAAIKKGERPLLLAYPLDSVTLIYYRPAKDASAQQEIYLKKIMKKEMKRVLADTYAIYSNLTNGQLFNLAANSITDEMGSRNFLQPQLVGYTALDGGTRWWSIDRMYSFTSPLIVEEKGTCSSFFPGLKPDQKCEVQSHQIEPLGVYQVQGRWYYVGIASSLGNTQDEYHQMIVLCDQAGNLLYSSKLLKQEIADALLQYVEKSNTNYTVRKAVKHVFVPAIDRRGDICYGMINFEGKKIDVYRRMFLRYQRQESKKLTSKVFERANELAYTPLLLDCSEGSEAESGVVPEFTAMTDDGIATVDKKALTKKGYFITVHRLTDDVIKKKLARSQDKLPPNIKKEQETIASQVSSWCPYSVVLNSESKGRIGTLHYGLNDEVLSARVLAVTDANRIFVRVDCEQWAEVVEFDSVGAFVNRFTFNGQEYSQRKDLVVVGKQGSVAEEDFEGPKGRQGYFIWRQMSADKVHSVK